MNTTIEEEVLDLVLKARYTDGDMEDLQKWVPTLFFDFIKWKDEYVGNPNSVGNYLYWEDHYTLEELCNYWLIYIKDK
jgi:hypothetical protein